NGSGSSPLWHLDLSVIAANGTYSSESLDHILVSCVFAREFCSLSGKGGTTDLFALIF
ncbi:hypothetical protein ACJX0J_013783, partial [Zea mays]